MYFGSLISNMLQLINIRKFLVPTKTLVSLSLSYQYQTNLQETGEKQVRIAWSTIRLPTALLKMMIIMRDATLWTCLHPLQ